MINVCSYLQLPKSRQTRIFSNVKSLAVYPEARTKFMGYKTFYLLLSIISQSWPGHQTLIIIPESVHPCYDFHDKVTLEGICPLHTTYLILCYFSPEAQLRESQKVPLVCQQEATRSWAQTWLMDKSLAYPLPSLSRVQGIKIFHPFLLPTSPAYPCRQRLPRKMGMDSLCRSYTISAERVLYSSCHDPFKTLLLYPDLKGPQGGNSLITFSSPARANLSKTLLQFPVSMWPKCTEFIIA